MFEHKAPSTCVWLSEHSKRWGACRLDVLIIIINIWSTLPFNSGGKSWESWEHSSY